MAVESQGLLCSQMEMVEVDLIVFCVEQSNNSVTFFSGVF
jgi:hypothetical protein